MYSTDPSTLTVSYLEQKYELTPPQFAVFEDLASYPGRIRSRQALWESSGLDREYPESNAVDAMLCRIRKRLPQELASRLESVRGAGYRFASTSSATTKRNSESLTSSSL